MKKLIMAVAIVCAAAFAKAAMVDWQYTGSSSEKDFTVFIFATSVAESYNTYSDFAAGALDSGVVVEAGGRTKTYSITNKTAIGDLGDTVFFAIIANSDATEFKFGQASTASYIYDPDAQQTSPGALKLTNASFTGAGTIGGTPGPGPDVPEPTSGLLLLVGMAGLALRRKQK